MLADFHLGISLVDTPTLNGLVMGKEECALGWVLIFTRQHSRSDGGGLTICFKVVDLLHLGEMELSRLEDYITNLVRELPGLRTVQDHIGNSHLPIIGFSS